MIRSASTDLPTFMIDQPRIAEQRFVITAYGAVGDGLYDNTEAFRQAIEDCSQAGGGIVVVPAGIWLTGPIQLKSNINLHVEFGALVLFTDDFTQYPLIQSTFEGEPSVRCQSPIDGEGLSDIAITGRGTFDAAGDSWRPVKKWKMTDMQWQNLLESGGVIDEEKQIWWPTEAAKSGHKQLDALQTKQNVTLADYQPIRDFLRPNLLSLRNCKRILIDGPTFQNSPAWNLHPWLCEHVTIQHVQVRNPWYSQNGDGLDVESCRYVSVRDCLFDVGDDAICIKSGKNEAGRKLSVPCQDVIIERCMVYSGHGGFVVGSEMSGGVKNIRISDCVFSGTDKGIRFKTTRGRGGVVEDIVIDNIQMDNIAKEAIIFQMYYETADVDITAHPVTEGTPLFRNISVEAVTCSSAEKAIVIKGLPEMPIEGLTFKNLSLGAKHGIECAYGKAIQFDSISSHCASEPLIHLHNCEDILMRKFILRQQANTFMYVSGTKTKDITCKDVEPNLVNRVQFGDDVDPNHVSYSFS